MKEQRIIRNNNSRYSSPLIVIPKKVDNLEKKYMMIVDYRNFNEVAINDKYPLSLTLNLY